MNTNNTHWLTIKDTSKWLGVTKQTVRNWISQGKFPAYQINLRGRILMKQEDIQAAIEAGELKRKK
jgi:excisionase family DNA binding protein